ncbi:MAG TPA: PKD domain-containing protein [Gaiellaceae bacterium]|nr:PKD domain-containing protein [Gaiellaceae bacterium]
MQDTKITPRISSRSLSRALHALGKGQSAAPWLTGYATTPEIDAKLAAVKLAAPMPKAIAAAVAAQLLTIQQGAVTLQLDATLPWSVTPSAPPPPTNLPPQANFAFTVANLIVTFADLSVDPDGTITARAWNFGDGTSSTLTSPVHSYVGAGTYNVTLTVTDNGSPGLTSTRSQQVTVTAAVTPPPGGIETTFDALYTSNFSLSQSTANRTIVIPPKPGKTPIGFPGYTDANHGTKVWRMTDRMADSNPAGTGHNRHEYSKRKVWSRGKSYYISTDNAGYWHVFNANTSQKIRQLPGFAGDCEPIWSPDDDAVLWHTGPYGALGWQAYNVATDTTSVLFDLTSKLPAGFTGAARAWFKGEGRPSNDGRYFALMIEKTDYTHLGVVMYDRAAGVVVGWLRQSERPDHSMTSSLGNFMVIGFGDGERSYPRTYQGTNKADGRRLASLQHNDVALDTNGREVLVTADYSGEPLNGFITVTDLATGVGFAINIAKLYPVTGAATGAHICGIPSEKRPGWIVANFESSYANYGSVHPDPVIRYQYDRVVAIELREDGHMLDLAEIFSCPNDDGTGNGYWSEPQSSSDEDLTRIATASSWTGRNGVPVGTSESFMTALSSTAIPPARPRTAPAS